MENLDLQLVSFNVGEFLPGPETDISKLLRKPAPDVLLFGLQEVRSGAQELLLEQLLIGEDAWSRETRKTLASLGFIKIRSIKLMGMVLLLFCLEKHVPYLRGLETQYTRLGFNGYWGNKGTVSIRFQIYGVSVCVLNSHLAAHDHNNQIRIDGYNTVMGTHTYQNPETELIMYHDYVFWMGDLNFRLEMNSFSFDEISLLVSQGSLSKLLLEDQLTGARSSGQAFSELEENIPTFQPTFKYKVGTTVFDPKRRPAWTDRILFKVNRGNYDNLELSLDQTSYSSHPEFLESDHKPVSSSFSLSVFSSKLAEQLIVPCFHPIVRFHIEDVYCGEDNTVAYSVSVKDWRLLKSWDWIGVYKVDDGSLQDHVGFLWAPATPSRQETFELYFDDSIFIRTGAYRLVYYTAESRDILGFSPVLHARVRDLVPEVGMEATEEL